MTHDAASSAAAFASPAAAARATPTHRTPAVSHERCNGAVQQQARQARRRRRQRIGCRRARPAGAARAPHQPQGRRLCRRAAGRRPRARRRARHRLRRRPASRRCRCAAAGPAGCGARVRARLHDTCSCSCSHAPTRQSMRSRLRCCVLSGAKGSERQQAAQDQGQEGGDQPGLFLDEEVSCCCCCIACAHCCTHAVAAACSQLHTGASPLTLRSLRGCLLSSTSRSVCANRARLSHALPVACIAQCAGAPGCKHVPHPSC